MNRTPGAGGHGNIIQAEIGLVVAESELEGGAVGRGQVGELEVGPPDGGQPGLIKNVGPVP